jgi:hypothetical protein
MAKKKEAIVIPDIDIKLAGGKKKASTEKLTIDSPTMRIPNPNFDAGRKVSATNPEEIEIPVVDNCISIKQQIESLTAQLKLYETDVVEAARVSKKEAENDNNFVKTIDVRGQELKLQIQFKDAYSKMDIAMRDPLKQIFGTAKYDIMFTEETIHTLRPEKIESLKELLGERFDDFFVTDESVKPSKEFQFNYFSMKDSLRAEQSATVQKVLDACQSNPTVKYPK